MVLIIVLIKVFVDS